MQGWSTPVGESNSYKCGVVESDKGIDGFKAVTEDGGTLLSPNVFVGKDKEGKPSKFRIHISVTPGQQALCVVKQIPVEAQLVNS